MVIKWSYFARDNLKDFIKNSKMSSPYKYAELLVEYVNGLVENNYLGKILCNINSKEVRQLIYKKHRILYYVFNDEIYIIAVLNTAQDLEGSLKFIKMYF